MPLKTEPMQGPRIRKGIIRLDPPWAKQRKQRVSNKDEALEALKRLWKRNMVAKRETRGIERLEGNSRRRCRRSSSVVVNSCTVGGVVQ